MLGPRKLLSTQKRQSLHYTRTPKLTACYASVLSATRGISRSFLASKCCHSVRLKDDKHKIMQINSI